MLPKKKKNTFSEWKKKCQTYADSIAVVAGDELWDSADSYSLKDEGEEAWANGEKPEIFIERVFAEDLANMEHDRELARQAMEEVTDEDGDEFEGEEETTPVIPGTDKGDKPN